MLFICIKQFSKQPDNITVFIILILQKIKLFKRLGKSQKLTVKRVQNLCHGTLEHMLVHGQPATMHIIILQIHGHIWERSENEQGPQIPETPGSQQFGAVL